MTKDKKNAVPERQALQGEKREKVMMKSEFEKLTGIYVTDQHYKVIEEAYMNCDEDKTVFCEAYKQNNDGRAEKIQREAEKKIAQKEAESVEALEGILQELNEQIGRAEGEIHILQEKLEAELEWTDHEVSSMTTDEYKNLSLYADESERMNMAEATEWLSREFGFSADKIIILNEIPRYQFNRHKQIRTKGKEKRNPVYRSTDWNYCRFDIAGRQYEVVNGELFKYED